MKTIRARRIRSDDQNLCGIVGYMFENDNLKKNNQRGHIILYLEKGVFLRLILSKFSLIF